jgi:hypothetical protein
LFDAHVQVHFLNTLVAAVVMVMLAATERTPPLRVSKLAQLLNEIFWSCMTSLFSILPNVKMWCRLGRSVVHMYHNKRVLLFALLDAETGEIISAMRDAEEI